MSRTKRHPDPITQSSPSSVAAEAYHTIRTNIQFRTEANHGQVILVTSAAAGEGRTTTTCNLAVTLSQSGLKVLVVDADMRNPDIHNRLHVNNDVGLSSVLSSSQESPRCIIPTDIPHLQVLPGGHKPENPSPLLAMDQFDGFISQVRQEFDVVLLDSPPLLTTSDALVIARLADGVVFVVDAQRTSRIVAQKALAQLKEMDVHIIGGILNRVPKHARKYPIGATLTNQQVTSSWNL
ncbi:tyrosine-protein kinase family protein [Alicyclobacillus sp. ALC3]|uniref:tyrosine-protein kinase family protein n=1 Tax=Alicyclobacillus sp. ALC3 TaxID=2796143 RepID=UPI0023785472|nr:CpsD/CapB family tyrosine-protein kinase [Alicyclobacillus sp. ALC3]WDL95247.1 CpsD/CapB family tyrosine-protein kinase [Alicyclobacillus sp. ALC3]